MRTTLKGKTNELQGHSSRKKTLIIEEAMARCENYEDKFNRYKICEKITEIMVERYSGGNLEYHSARMGMETTTKILREIDRYFYKEIKLEYNF